AGRLGWIKEIKGAGGTWNIVEPSLSTAKILAFLGEAGYQSLVALRHALEEFGPFALFLAGVALTHLWRVRRYRRAFLGIAVPYLALIAAWSAFQLRFLVPAAALLFVAAGVGWRRLWRSQRQICRILAYLCAAGGLLWPAALWMQNIPMRYYPPQVAREYGARYEKMRALALRLARLERGLVAGWTQASGGGLESVYWHRMPFIDLRGADAEKVKRILGDFPVRYLWCECREIEKIKGWPFAFRLLMQNGGYAVFEVSRGPGKEDAPLEKNR
ncbi:MAG: hypothetical protein N3A66_12265, partial [Planctomycetota bacterium]|nr:hypothetical protein [Planctomycetota bacterium]